MRKFFGYIRVSTPRQGEHGVSLQEQRDAITRYATRYSLEVAAWFEERETAAKRGRPIFTQMLRDLRRGKADGVIIHKIDRSARNLKDWSDLGELIDQGIEVHFANESLDLHSRGGRLSADIQAVVAADYIRNLREETRKGFYGRIKQGLYPLPAPIGYTDQGQGKAKLIDPMKGPLVKKAFELYGTGRYSLTRLVDELCRLGLRNQRGGKVTRNGLSTILNNAFYVGLVHLKKTGETFPGIHLPLVSKSLFDRVQAILKGKTIARTQVHDFLFRRLLQCTLCGRSLTGELQKGNTYYRCHTKGCPTAIREQDIEREVLKEFSYLQFTNKESTYLREKISQVKSDWANERESVTTALELGLNQIKDRLNRLTDAYIDRLIEKELFEQRKTALLLEQKDVEEKFTTVKEQSESLPTRLSEFFELAESVYLQYQLALPEEKRDLLKIVSSNRLVEGKRVDITLSFPFSEVAHRAKNTIGRPQRDRLRTLDQLLSQLTKHFAQNPTPRLKASDKLPKR